MFPTGKSRISIQFNLQYQHINKNPSHCPRSRPLPTTSNMGTPKLHPGSRQHRRRMDLERTPRPHPHAHHDRILRRRRMDSRLPAMLRVRPRHFPLCPLFPSFLFPHLTKNQNSNIRPGGWIEQLEASPYIECDDDSLPADNILRTWGPALSACGKRAGRPLETIDMMQDAFRKAGFVDICEKEYKWPIGPWARDQRYKEAGTVNYQHWMSGMEGWAMWLLCKFGAPEPWSHDEVIVYVAKLRAELQKSRYHVYERAYVFLSFLFVVCCLADFYADDVCGRGNLFLRRLRRERGLRLIRGLRLMRGLLRLRRLLRLRSEFWTDGIVLLARYMK